MLKIKKNVDISTYHKVTSFLKTLNVDYKPKKSTVFSQEDVEKFLSEAPDDRFLMMKVKCNF